MAVQENKVVLECEGCIKSTNWLCDIYPKPLAFIREGSQFRCPVKGYSESMEKKGTAGRVRVGQQKQKSFKQKILGGK